MCSCHKMSVRADNHQQIRFLYQELQSTLISKGYHCDYKSKPIKVKEYDAVDCYAVCLISPDSGAHTMVGKVTLYENERYGLIVIRPECPEDIIPLNSALGSALDKRADLIRTNPSARTRFDIVSDHPTYLHDD